MPSAVKIAASKRGSVTKGLTWATRVARRYKVWEIPAGSNHTRVWTWYHKLTGAIAYMGSPWCGAFGICVDYHAGSEWKPPSNWISVNAIQSWGEANGRWHRGSAGVKPGDALVIEGPGVHTGRSRSEPYPDGSVDSAEGNTSPGSEGSQFDGGTVALKRRTAGEIYGYTRIHDLLGGGKAPKDLVHAGGRTQPQYRKEPATGDLKAWETGPRVERLQRQLGIHADGYYGHDTIAAVRAYKKAHHYKHTGGKLAGNRIRTELGRSPRLPDQHHKTLRPVSPGKASSKGGAVRKLQRLLINAGYLTAHADHGDYGPETVAAVNQVRRKHGWKPTGVAGRRVWKELTR